MPSRRTCLASLATALAAPRTALAGSPKPGVTTTAPPAVIPSRGAPNPPAVVPSRAGPVSGSATRLRKALKYGMIKQGKSVAERFALARDCGFEGVEIESPSRINRKDAVAASRNTGLVIHGVVTSLHLKYRLSDPDGELRAKGLEALLGALADARVYGASTVLVVPGGVTDPGRETFEQVWQRSQTEVKKALRVARALSVKIALDVAGNDFLTTPEQTIKYVDELDDPMVGAYFDVSSVLKYGVPAGIWIRKLGPRMLKFDFRGYSHKKKWVPIGDGDEDWADVRAALDEVDYVTSTGGWATAEVDGGGKRELIDVATRMDRVLGLG